MKRTHRKHTYSAQPIRRYAYPNAAEPGYFLERLAQGCVALISVTASVFFFALVLTL